MVAQNLRSSITLTLSRGWWGRCKQNYLPKEEGRVEEKSMHSVPGDIRLGLKPGAYRMLGEGPQLHVTGVV